MNSLTEQYIKRVNEMTIAEAKAERKKVQNRIDKGEFDTCLELSFQLTKLKILNENLGPEPVSQPPPPFSNPIKKRSWRFWNRFKCLFST